MARNSAGRYLLEGNLVAETPIHVGAWGNAVDTDLPLARNGAGQWYLPGTSLAGVLRAASESQDTESLWGPRMAPGRESGSASWIFVDDAVISQGGGSPRIEVRDSVGIDRGLGVAANRIKFDRAVIPRGASIPLRVAVEMQPQGGEDSGGDIEQRLLSSLRRMMERALLRIGAGQTRGLGKVRLHDATLHQQRWDTRDGMLSALKGEFADIESPDDDDLAGRDLINIQIHWRGLGPVMNKAGNQAVAVDMVPLMSDTEAGLAIVMAGTSVKGVLRSQAEKILRTLGVKSYAEQKGDPKADEFLNQIDLPLLEFLFGLRGLSEKEREKRPTCHGNIQPGRGALAVDDCYGTQRVSDAAWRAVMGAADDGKLREALAKAGLGSWQQAYHVAIDRWTGGAAEGFLYNVLEPHEVAWEPLELTIDHDRIPKQFRDPAMALLMLVLRDLSRQRLPLGFAANRGMGAVAIDEVVIEGWGSEPVQLAEGQLEQLGPDRLSKLEQGWKQWLKETVAAQESA